MITVGVVSAHGMGESDALLDRVAAHERLAARPAAQRRWSAYVHQIPEEAELAAIRRSSETGLPLGERGWVALSGTGAGPDHPSPRSPAERRTTNEKIVLTPLCAPALLCSA